MSKAKDKTDNTVVILTALDLEYGAVREHLTDVESYAHPTGTRWEIGAVPDRSCRVAIGTVGKGNHSSAVLAERAVAEFEPLALIFVGVAGGLRDDIELGDVVVATHIYAYHGGTSEDGQFSARPRAWEAPHELDQLAGDVARSGSWTALLRRGRGRTPSVYRAPIAAGEVVLQSLTSTEARRIRLHYNDAAAVEMESAGIAQAGQLNAFPVMVVRGISDAANAEKTATDRQGWQPMAAQHAAAFAITLTQRLAAERPSRAPARKAQAVEPASVARPTFSNVAQGNAQVGIQAGQIFGGAYVDQPAPVSVDDLGTLLKQLQVALEDAYRAGQLDAETYESAHAELATAKESLPADHEKPERRFVLALKRLKGLLEDIADFGSKIANILSSTGGLR